MDELNISADGVGTLEEFLYRTDPFQSNTFHGHDNSEMKTEFLTTEELPRAWRARRGGTWKLAGLVSGHSDLKENKWMN
jgi:hypothetical protein